MFLLIPQSQMRDLRWRAGLCLDDRLADKATGAADQLADLALVTSTDRPTRSMSPSTRPLPSTDLSRRRATATELLDHAVSADRSVIDPLNSLSSVPLNLYPRRRTLRPASKRFRFISPSIPTYREHSQMPCTDLLALAFDRVTADSLVSRIAA